MPPDNQPLTQSLIDLLRQRGKLHDARVEAAFAAVPRHLFMPDAPLADVYSDTSIPIQTDARGQATCSDTMPSMVAHLLQQLELHEGMNVLHIGTGTGYIAALISHIIGPGGVITSLEIDRAIAKKAEDNFMRTGYAAVKVVHTDGAEGYSPRAAYDRIVATTGIWDIPPAWIHQLKAGGRIVAPIFINGLQVIASFSPQPDGTFFATGVMPSAFVYIRGIAAGPEVRRQIGSSALVLLADDAAHIDSVTLHLLLTNDAEICRLSASLNTIDYWYGFVPYLMLNVTSQDTFALYTIWLGQQAYGMAGEGFALLTQASASFVPYYGMGAAHCFAGADAYLDLEQCLLQWQRAGHPTIDRLCLRLIPKTQPKPAITVGRLYIRRDHYLHVWLDI